MRVLEVGTGSGYHAALCAELVRSGKKSSLVFTVERIRELAVLAFKNLKKTGYTGIVRVFHRDGSLGLEEKSPFDRIMVTAASPMVPPPLIEQLGDPGRLVIPVGEIHLWQNLILIEKKDGKIKRVDLGGVAFVPLIGKYGFEYD